MRRRTQKRGGGSIGLIITALIIASVVYGAYVANGRTLLGMWELAKSKSQQADQAINNAVENGVNIPGAPSLPPANEGESSSAVVVDGGVLASIPTAEKDTSVTYDRDSFKHWSSQGSACWDTRDMILARDATGAVYLDADGNEVAGSGGACSVEGEWVDPYSGSTVTRARSLDIDHVVPLGYANGHGAASWDAAMKEKFANDPENLLAVSARENRRKSDSGPGEYLPPNTGYQCEYVKKFVSVVGKYGLSMSAADKAAVEGVLSGC